MRRKLKWMVWAVEINLLLWLVIAGSGLRHGGGGSTVGFWGRPVSVDGSILCVGIAFSILVQHWAYYRLYKEAKTVAGLPNSTD